MSGEGLLPQLQRRLLELFALGPYEPEARTGPAIWLRCVVDGTLDAPDPSAERTPILYLPGFERGQLRAGEACPDAVRPLVELLYRGVLWNHPNGKDWTVAAFLGSAKGVGLDIAGDRTTLDALRGALAGGGGATGGPAAWTPPGRGRLQRDAGERLPARSAALDG